MKKRGEILIENLIFIILNVVFLTILALFLLKQGSGTVLLESAYAKEIALIVDSAKPDMVVKINLENALDVAEKNGIPFAEVVSFEGNYVKVKLNEDGGYLYHFFNDITVNPHTTRDSEGEFTGIYVLTFSRK